MAINIDMSGYVQVRPAITVGSANTIGTSTGIGTNSTGDVFVDADTGTASIWSGIAWDEVGVFKNFEQRTIPMRDIEGYRAISRPCPYCGMLNLPDAVECGAGRWNGCGAPLRKQ